MSKGYSKLFISMYHYTRDLQNSRYPNIKGLDINLFRQQIKFFKENFNVVRMEQVIEAVTCGTSLPEKAVLLTFDDGYSDNFTFVLPILEEYGLQGSFFIPGKTFTSHELLNVNKIHYILAADDTGQLLKDVFERMDFYRWGGGYKPNDLLFNEYAVPNRFDSKEVIFIKRMLQTVLPEEIRNQISSDLFKKYVGVSEKQLAYELYMTPEQIMLLKRHGMYIGVHGYDHYWLSSLTVQEMQNDILKALDAMSEFIDKDQWVMNYPYGDFNQNVIDFIQANGAVIGLTTEVCQAKIGADSPFMLPRLDCNDFPPKSENYKNFEGVEE